MICMQDEKKEAKSLAVSCTLITSLLKNVAVKISLTIQKKKDSCNDYI